MEFFRNQPLFVIFMWIAAFSMLIPMAYAVRLEEWLIARTFFYNSTFFLIITSLIAIATYGQRLHTTVGEYMFSILFAFAVIPAILAAPVSYIVGPISFFQAYFEMVSCLTTTGATLFNDPDSISPVLHLWRGLVSWMGGFLMLVVAIAIFEPLKIGGFELFSVISKSSRRNTQIERRDTHAVLGQYAIRIAPFYAGVTAVIVLALMTIGERGLVAVIHAMSTVSTSGISMTDGFVGANTAGFGEVIIFLGLTLAVSRHMMQLDSEGRGFRSLKQDKEMNLMLICVFGIPFLLFMRHYIGSYDVDSQDDIQAALSSIWGGIFTVLSFLTTTGFESQHWDSAQNWSGLRTPGLILMGLAVMGGGIATTAGGVKLLRVYALYKHGLREMQRLSFPHSVAGAGAKARTIRREGAYVAWIFFMLFILSLGVIMLALSATGLDFEDALVFAIAGLSTTGPLVSAAGENGLTYAEISDGAKAILCAAMILGRLEALAVFAILNPAYWRD